MSVEDVRTSEFDDEFDREFEGWDEVSLIPAAKFPIEYEPRLQEEEAGSYGVENEGERRHGAMLCPK